MRGNWKDALPVIRQLRVESSQRGDLQNVLNHDYGLANCFRELHRFGYEVDVSEVEAVMQEALEISLGGFGSPIPPLCILAILRMYQNRLPEARQSLQKARQSKKNHLSFWDRVYLYLAEAFRSAAESRWEEAFAAFEASIERISSAGYQWTQAITMIDWADALVRRGEPADMERARTLLREAGALFEQMGSAGYLQLVEKKRQDLREKTLAQAVLRGEVVREMAQASRVQKSFLPEEPPQLSGWQLAVLLEPVRETSGDYYDFINLPEGRLGIVVADVADKGAAAALFMTSSRSLIRAFAEEYPDDPSQVILSANHRLVLDTHAGLFVTIFYGVLNLSSGILSYCNGGHNPPYILDSKSGELKVKLVKTGIPMGIQEDSSWSMSSVEIDPGDVLVIFTDGVTELQNDHGEFYGETRLLQATQAIMRKSPAESLSAQVILDNLIVEINRFLGGAPRSDDLTLLILVRNIDPSPPK
jgi:serine phosphatase RsbU (regulator of sigma subunit)